MVFEAWSASNISLYEYRRENTSKLTRLAEIAIVYRQHYAGSHLTTPRTYFLLTGTLPWTLRSFEFDQQLADVFLQKDIFQTLPQYSVICFDEWPCFLIGVLLDPLVMQADQFRKEHYFYEKHGSCTLFAIIESLTGFRLAQVHQRRTKNVQHHV